MSTFYLLSVFNDQINDVVSPPSSPGSTVVTGNYVVRVADDVVVKNPVSVSDLVTQKYASILSSHGLFTQIIFDDMLDATEINAANSSGVVLGVKGMNSVFDAGVLETSPLSITWGGGGAGPAQAIMTYEVFQYTDSDLTAGPYSRTYTEVTPGTSPFTVQISFNGGSTFQACSDKNLLNITIPSQGTSLILRFTHTGTPRGRYFLGSWAIVF